MKKYYIGLLMLFSVPFTLLAQQPDFPLKPLPFNEWKVTKGWQTAGSFSVNPFTNNLDLTAGKSVYVGSGKGGAVETKDSFGDCQISFDFVLSPKAEGVFKIWNEYGVALSTKQHTLGGITTSKGGTFAPLTDAAGRVTGIWQHAEIAVRKADGIPGKALIEYVKINGIVTLQNVFVDATETSGIMSFVSSKGQLAVRDFKILSFADVKPISVTKIKYDYYKEFDWENQKVANGSTPELTGSMQLLHHDVGQGRVRQNFLTQYEITVEVAKKGNYAFLLDYAGNASLAVDNKTLVEKAGQQNRVPKVAYVSLEKGTHTLQLEYSKAWWRAQLGLFIAGDGIRPYPIHALTSLSEKRLPGEIVVNPTTEPEVIRSFFMHGEEKRTHVASVGSPEGFHYAFDLNQGALLAAWKGDFANVTEMWYQRGEPQILQPKGLTIALSGKPMVVLKSQKNDLPDSYESMSEIDYQTTRFDENEQPSFVHKFKGQTITQTISPFNEGLKHEVSIDGDTNDLLLRIAEGQDIEKINSYIYRVDDYYVKLSFGGGAELLKQNGTTTLVVPAMPTFSYSIIW